MRTATPTRKTKPRKTSARKRPNKGFIGKMVEFRGFMTGNEKTLIEGLTVKNALQRINNVGMADDVNEQFTTAQNAELQRLMKEFVKGVNETMKTK